MFLDDQYAQTQRTLPDRVTKSIVSDLLRIASSDPTRHCSHCIKSTRLDESLDGITFNDLVATRWDFDCTGLGNGMVRIAEAAFELCYCYTVGYGVQASDDEALKWLVFAASNGVERAKSIVKPLYDSAGKDIPEDLPYMTWLYNGMIAGSMEAARYLEMIAPDFHEIAREILMRCFCGVGSRPFWTDHDPWVIWPVDNIEDLKKALRPMKDPIDDITVNGTYDDRLVHLAAATDFSETLNFLVTSLNANINITNQLEETALLAACRSGRLSTAKILLEYGADVTTATVHGTTALHWLHTFQ